jgi:hypothetical protein
MQTSVTKQLAHTAPPWPQAAALLVVTQTPDESQQPVLQVCALQRGRPPHAVAIDKPNTAPRTPPNALRIREVWHRDPLDGQTTLAQRTLRIAKHPGVSMSSMVCQHVASAAKTLFWSVVPSPWQS